MCHVGEHRVGRRRPGLPTDLLGLGAQEVGNGVCARDRKGCAGLLSAGVEMCWGKETGSKLLQTERDGLRRMEEGAKAVGVLCKRMVAALVKFLCCSVF